MKISVKIALSEAFPRVKREREHPFLRPKGRLSQKNDILVPQEMTGNRVESGVADEAMQKWNVKSGEWGFAPFVKGDRLKERT